MFFVKKNTRVKINRFIFALTTCVLSQSVFAVNERYEIIESGTVVRDRITGLEWQRCSLGQTWNGNTCTGTSSQLMWNDAASIHLNSDHGFFLPSADQLRTLVYCSNTGLFDSNGDYQTCEEHNFLIGDSTIEAPTIDTKAFPETQLFWFYWTSSHLINHPSRKIAVSFQNGGTTWRGAFESHHIRLVRFGTPDPTPISKPYDIVIDNVTESTIKIIWKNTESEISTYIEVSEESAFLSNSITYQTDSNELEIDNLEPNKIYFIRLKSSNESGFSDYTDTIEIVTLSETSNKPKRRSTIPRLLLLIEE